jgi:aspartyl aminopeptidase
MVEAKKYKVTKELLQEAQPFAQKIVDGLNASPSHFHAVEYCKDQLKQAGFTQIRECDRWTLEAGKGYYFTRNNSTIVAFLAGAQCG